MNWLWALRLQLYLRHRRGELYWFVPTWILRTPRLENRSGWRVLPDEDAVGIRPNHEAKRL